MRPPSDEREHSLSLIAFEFLLRSLDPSKNGHGMPEDLRWLLSFHAIRAPQCAVRCERLMAVLDAEVTDAVRRLAGVRQLDPVSPPDGTPVAADTGQPAGWHQGRAWLDSREAARRLGTTGSAVRKAIKRKRLRATWTSGGWRIDPADLNDYARRRR